MFLHYFSCWFQIWINWMKLTGKLQSRQENCKLTGKLQSWQENCKAYRKIANWQENCKADRKIANWQENCKADRKIAKLTGKLQSLQENCKADRNWFATKSTYFLTPLQFVRFKNCMKRKYIWNQYNYIKMMYIFIYVEHKLLKVCLFELVTAP